MKKCSQGCTERCLRIEHSTRQLIFLYVETLVFYFQQIIKSIVSDRALLRLTFTGGVMN